MLFLSFVLVSFNKFFIIAAVKEKIKIKVELTIPACFSMIFDRFNQNFVSSLNEIVFKFEHVLIDLSLFIFN